MSDSIQNPVSDSKNTAGVATVRGEALRVTYRGRTVLQIDEISLPAGRTFALLGASGAGKSTLLRVLGLLEKPTAGRVFFDGQPADRRSLSTRRQIAAVFQKPYLLRGTVAANVDYGLRLRGVGASERAHRVDAALKRVGLADWQSRSALTLSGGEAQRVALARALVLEPRLLLLDEPLSYMDPLLKRQLSLEFADILSDEGVTALYVTHDQDEAAVVADHIGVMRDGCLISQGDPQSVLALPLDPWVASFLGTVPPFEGVVAAVDNGVARIDCSGVQVQAVTSLPLGTEVVVGIRPEDVLIFERDVELLKTSARNRIEGRVAELSPAGVTVNVLIELGGIQVASAVSRASAESLALTPGAPVTAVFKATAVRVAER